MKEQDHLLKFKMDVVIIALIAQYLMPGEKVEVPQLRKPLIRLIQLLI